MAQQSCRYFQGGKYVNKHRSLLNRHPYKGNKTRGQGGVSGRDPEGWEFYFCPVETSPATQGANPQTRKALTHVLFQESARPKTFLFCHTESCKVKKSPFQKGGPRTLDKGRTMKAPPPADSTMMARNLGLTAQNVESHEDLETRTLS